MNAGFTADDPFRNGRAEDKAAESHAGNLSKTWGGDTVSSGTPLFHSYGLDWMGYSLWNGRGPCCPTENPKNSRSVPGRRVLLLRPIQHTGLYGLSAVCKKGRLVPLVQERPFLIFYLSLFPNLLFCWNYCGFQQNFCFCQQVQILTGPNFCPIWTRMRENVINRISFWDKVQ